ncbi:MULTISPECIES: hypothetical protein [Pandoraea]|uniref:hypothetical protein n=1 Tax=Pandoraea TaxID=93217 RepID=UPI001F5CF6E6|nr:MULTISPECIES: hypothetical protein [Pandoraea]MCI3207314.1 hypothetical protein [Pandoraea sp. LA3]MDN4585343.1 hypothetical protein [Pandoraea capi]
MEQITNAFGAEGKRIGITKDGQLVTFKGRTFLLHPHQCKRAQSLLKHHDLSTEPPRSIIDAFKFKDLRTDRAPVQALLTRLALPGQPRQPEQPTNGTSSATPGTHPLEASRLVTPEQSRRQLPPHLLSAMLNGNLPTPSGDGLRRGSDDGYDTDASENYHRVQHQAAQLRREFDAMMAADNPPPPLPAKQDRNTFIASVDKSREMHEDFVPDSATSPRPVPKPRITSPVASPPKPPRTFAFDLTPRTGPSLSRSVSEDSNVSKVSESPPFASSRDSLDTVLTLKPLPETPDEARVESASRSSGASSILEELRASGRAKDTLIQTMLRTRKMG